MKQQKQSGPILSENARIVEVILFLENEPVEKEKLARMTGLSSSEVKEAIDELADHYNTFMHGLTVNENSIGYLLTPSSDLFGKLKTTYGKKVERRLSKAALETLSIVAYGQPVTRREIDNIRGVSSDTIVKLLREREYIKIVGRKDVPGHPCLYGTTKKFLYEFNLSSISDLPRLSQIDEERFEKENDKDDNEEEEKEDEN
jgi:segregation and condensation protein B